MAREININSDMAEGFGAYDIGNDNALLKIINSANVACGFHAGDPSVMHRFVMRAKEEGVSIGAHPGFQDLQGFGRRQIQMKAAEVEYITAYQIGALQAMACYAGLKVTHMKGHGALANMAMVDEAYAMAFARAVKTVDSSLIFMAHHGSKLQKAAEKFGLRMALEGYADRQYEDDGMLASRAIPGTVIRDAEVAAAQALRMVQDGEIVSRHGKILKVKIDSVCVHGDEPTAVDVATAVRRGFTGAGFTLLPLDRMKLVH
jgi:5-oxoprolinase (ATP-hydrolysing) subunit A